MHIVREGRNDAVGAREVYEAEVYGLRLSHLVLPVRDHRIERLGAPARSLADTPLPFPHLELPSSALGLAASAGLAALMVRLVGALVARRRDGERPEDVLLDRAAAAALVAVLVGAAGGAATVVGLAGFTQIRAWARLVVFVAFLALLAAAVYGDRFLRRRQWPSLARAGLVIPILAVGLFDQTTDAAVPRYDLQRVRWERDEALVAGVESEFGARASVFQLPHVPFPEHPPPATMEDYDHLRGFLHSDSLRWSYATMKGRPDAEELARIGALAPAEMVGELRRLGFDALWLNPAGYGDPSQITAELTTVLGEPVLRGGVPEVAVFLVGGGLATG